MIETMSPPLGSFLSNWISNKSNRTQPEDLVHFERDHSEDQPGIPTEGQIPVEAESRTEARNRVFDGFNEPLADQSDIPSVETR